MSIYNIEIDESLVSRVRPSFKNDEEMKEWMQEQIVQLMIRHKKTDSKQFVAKDRKSALEFVQSLAVPGGYAIPAEEDGIGCLVSEKYD